MTKRLLIFTAVLIMASGGISCNDQKRHQIDPEELDVSWLAKDLNFDDGQQAQFDAMTRGFYETVKPLMQNKKDTKMRIYQILTQDDEKKVNAALLATSLGPTEISLQQYWMNYFSALFEICTPEQRVKLMNIFSRLVI